MQRYACYSWCRMTKRNSREWKCDSSIDLTQRSPSCVMCQLTFCARGHSFKMIMFSGNAHASVARTVVYHTSYHRDGLVKVVKVYKQYQATYRVRVCLTNPSCSCMACCTANNAPCKHGSQCNVISIFTLQTPNTHPSPNWALSTIFGVSYSLCDSLSPTKGGKSLKGEMATTIRGPPQLWRGLARGASKVDQRAYTAYEGCIIRPYILNTYSWVE